MVRQAAAGDLGGALEGAYDHLALVQAERALASAADAAVALRRLLGWVQELVGHWRALGQVAGGGEEGVRWVDSDGPSGSWRLRVAFIDAA